MDEQTVLILSCCSVAIFPFCIINCLKQRKIKTFSYEQCAVQFQSSEQQQLKPAHFSDLFTEVQSGTAGNWYTQTNNYTYI